MAMAQAVAVVVVALEAQGVAGEATDMAGAAHRAMEDMDSPAFIEKEKTGVLGLQNPTITLLLILSRLCISIGFQMLLWPSGHMYSEDDQNSHWSPEINQQQSSFHELTGNFTDWVACGNSVFNFQ